MPTKLGKAIGYAFVLWLVGIIWGSIVFMIPSWKAVSEISYISQNPVMSIPNLIFYFVLIWFFAKGYLKNVENKKTEAKRFAATMIIVNLILDNLFIILFAENGWPSYLATLSVILGYLMMIFIPLYLAGRLLTQRQ